MRKIGLDVGDKTVGIAVSDPLGFTAQGIMTLEPKPSMPKRERGAKRCRASVFSDEPLLDIGFSAMTGQGLSNVRRRKMIKENRKI